MSSVNCGQPKEREAILERAAQVVLARLANVLIAEVQLLSQRVRRVADSLDTEASIQNTERVAALALSRIVRSALAKGYPEQWDYLAIGQPTGYDTDHLREDLRARVSQKLSQLWHHDGPEGDACKIQVEQRRI